MNCPIDRLFTETDAERVDDLGFLDPGRTPRLLRVEEIFREPIAWVLGPPWIGKSRVAAGIDRWLTNEPSELGGVEDRHSLTKLDLPIADRQIPPSWWVDWCRDKCARPAIWLIDGVDERLDRNEHLFLMLLTEIGRAPKDHLRQLRLVLFSRPYAESSDFRDQLDGCYTKVTGRSESRKYWLARPDRDAAEQIVGAESFPRVMEVIRKNNLQRVAGYPIVLQYLAQYREAADLSIATVWRGVLEALLGERQTNQRAQFETELSDRFNAACQIAAILTLMRRNDIWDYAMDPDVPTFDAVFSHAENRLRAAARDACQTAVFTALPQRGAFRFAQRNVQDWFTAFALEKLPLPALRSALSDENGKLATRLAESARLIETVTDRDEVHTEIEQLSGGTLLPSDVFEPTLADALRCIGRLEELAQNSPWGVRIRDEESLARLRVDGLGKVIATRLRDPARPAQVKRLLMDVANATRASEVVDVAVELVLDISQHDEVRFDAMWLTSRLGGQDHLRRLEGPIAECDGGSDVDQRLRGMLISELLRRELWPVWRAALHAPPVDRDVIDSRAHFFYSLPDQLTIRDARQLLPHFAALFGRHADFHHPDGLPAFLNRAIELVIRQQTPDAQDIDELVRFALGLANEDHGWAAIQRVAAHLRPFVAARRRFYEHDIEAIRRGEFQRRIMAQWLLIPEDWQWLRDQALGPWKGVHQVWDDAYSLARESRLTGQLTEVEWEDFVATVEQHAPGLPAQFEHNIAQCETERQEREAEQRERDERDPARRPLAERVSTLLDDESLRDDRRMRQLGILGFPRAVGLHDQRSGEWGTLPAELRKRALDACRRGLEAGEPTAIPEGRSFPGTILDESAAFSQVVLSPEHAGWLSEPIIGRWLRTALFAQLGENWPALIRACWAVSPPATERVLTDVINDQTTRYDEPIQLAMIPSECWTDAMIEQLARLATDGAVRPRGRGALLLQVVACSPGRAASIAADWAARPVVEDDSDHLRQAGRNALLLIDPAHALGLIEPDACKRGTSALEELHVLHGWPDEPHIRWAQWPLALIEQLGALLLNVYPPTNDPVSHSGFVTTNHDLRQLRDAIITFLLQRSDKEANAALDRLAQLDANVRAWVESRRASEQARQLIPTFDPSASRDPAAMSRSEAVRIVDRKDYRLIRCADDLLDTVMEALGQINRPREIGYDVALLYNAPDRRAKAKPATRAIVRKHLEEDALQTYLRRRLIELLPRFVDGAKIKMYREDQISLRGRLDIRVTAPCHGTRGTATVVIEVKWSDNSETRSGLVDQLGERYLLREGLTHGIFLVGWCGEWCPGAGRHGMTDAEELRRFLRKQKDEFCAPGQPGETLRIEPYVLDARWSQRIGRSDEPDLPESKPG
jgi:hypothetical protein